MNKQQLEAALDRAYSETGRLRIAIMRAVNRDPYDYPPSDEVLIGELAKRDLTDRQMRRWHVIEREDGSISVYYTTPTSQAQFVVWDSLGVGPSGLTSLAPDACGGQTVDNQSSAAAGAGEDSR